MEEQQVEVVNFDPKSFCARENFSLPTLYRLWEAGVGPEYVKIGARTLIPKTSVLEWEAKLPDLDIEGALKALREKKARA